jgi:hypothetical protein
VKPPGRLRITSMSRSISVCMMTHAGPGSLEARVGLRSRMSRIVLVWLELLLMGDVMRSKPTTWPSRMNSMKASQPGVGRRHVSSCHACGCTCKCELVLTVETRFAEVTQDLRDDGVERVVWPRDREVVKMRRGSLEVICSLFIATAAAIVAGSSRGLATSQFLEVHVIHAHRCAIVVDRRRLADLHCAARGFVSLPCELLTIAGTV